MFFQAKVRRVRRRTGEIKEKCQVAFFLAKGGIHH